MEEVKQRIRYDNCFIVDKLGGLSVLWKLNTNLEIIIYSQNFIDTIITRRDGL